MAQGRTKARRLLSSVLNAPWLVKQDWLMEFAGLAEEARARGDDFSADELREKLRASLASLSTSGETPEAIAVSYGEPLGEGLRATLRDGVAIIPVTGPLYHYASHYDDVCGCSSYEQIARDFRAALDRPDVASILLEVDSPGGEVAGCFELAEAIYDARAEKPITAYVSDLGCSAAYAIASAAGEVVVSKTAVLGSIGVVMTFTDTSERDAKSGVRRFEILSSQSPNKRANPNTEDGRAQIQQMLDDLAQVFIEDVARNRGSTVDTVLSDFGQGGVMVGARAVAAGLADRIGSFEGVLAELADASASRRGIPAAGGIQSTLSEEPTMANGTQTATPAADAQPANQVTAESVTQDHPEVAAALRGAGATAERVRITGILGLAKTDADRKIALACVESGATKGDAAEQILAARDAAGQREATRAAQHLSAVKADEEQLDAPAAAADAEPSGEQAQIAAILNAGKIPAQPTR